MANEKTYYTKEHEWLQVVEGNKVRGGITEHAAQQLGDIVFVDYTAELGEVAKGDEVVTVESVKSVSDVYAPVSGTITQFNENLNENPEIVNDSAMAEGWMWEMEISDESQLEDLLSLGEYEAFLAEEE